MDLVEIATDCFGIRVVTLTQLPGYEDLNARVTDEDGRQFVLKISAEGTERPALEGQQAALEHLLRTDPDLPIPRVMRSDGEGIIERDGRLIRLLTWLDGEFLAHVRPTPALMRSFGALLGRMDRALSEFTHRGLARTMEWDLLEVLATCEDLDALTDPGRRGAVEHLRTALEREMPSLLRLRRSVIHNDANDHNVLVGADRVTGLIDFGDMVESASVGELAVAATYAMMGCGDPLAVTAELVAGYHEQFPLREDDLAALYPLICARLCLSVVHSARSSAANPDNTYITVSEESAWALISTMLEVQPEAAESTFRAACGLDSDRSHHA